MTDKLRQWVHETIQNNKSRVNPIASGQHAEEVEFWLVELCAEIENEQKNIRKLAPHMSQRESLDEAYWTVKSDFGL